MSDKEIYENMANSYKEYNDYKNILEMLTKKIKKLAQYIFKDECDTEQNIVEYYANKVFNDTLADISYDKIDQYNKLMDAIVEYQNFEKKLNFIEMVNASRMNELLKYNKIPNNRNVYNVNNSLSEIKQATKKLSNLNFLSNVHYKKILFTIVKEKMGFIHPQISIFTIANSQVVMDQTDEKIKETKEEIKEAFEKFSKNIDVEPSLEKKFINESLEEISEYSNSVLHFSKCR